MVAVSGAESAELVKSLAGGKPRRDVSQVPLAEGSRCVASGLEYLCNRYGFQGQTVVACRFAGNGAVEFGSEPLLVLAGQHRRACWRAHGAVAMKIGESQALACQAVDVRREVGLAAIAAEVAVAKVVGKDKDDVRAVRGHQRHCTTKCHCHQGCANIGRRTEGRCHTHLLKVPK